MDLFGLQRRLSKDGVKIQRRTGIEQSPRPLRQPREEPGIFNDPFVKTKSVTVRQIPIAKQPGIERARDFGPFIVFVAFAPWTFSLAHKAAEYFLFLAGCLGCLIFAVKGRHGQG